MYVGCHGGEAEPEKSQPCDPLEGACATRVESEERLIGGMRATGRVGDFLLENDRARFLIEQPCSKIAVTSQFGGNLVDADIRIPGVTTGRDVFGELGFLINLTGTVKTESVEILDPGGPGSRAVVVTRGSYALNGFLITDLAFSTKLGFDIYGIQGTELDRIWPLTFQILYSLEPGSQAMRVELTAFNRGREAVPYGPAYFIHGGLVNSFVQGFPAFAPPLIAAADRLFFESNDPSIPLSYGMIPDDRDAERILVGVLGSWALLHRGGLIDFGRFPHSSPYSIAPGESVTVGSYFVVGEDLDQTVEIADILGVGEEWDSREPACTPVLGRVVEEGTGAPIGDTDVTALVKTSIFGPSRAVTNALSNKEGLFHLCLEPGRAELIAGQVGRPFHGGGTEALPVSIRVPERNDLPPVPDVTLRLPRTARLRINVTDEQGRTMPSRLLILGVDPSPHDHRLCGDDFDPVAPGVIRMDDSLDGTFDVLVEPVEMDVVVTRGGEYSMFRQPMSLSPGETRELDVRLCRVVDTSGYLSGDFHVHSAPGPDSTLTYRKRVTNMLAEGVEVIVATDHAFVSDYGPTIREMGVEEQVASIPGQEISTFATGHFGAFPLPRTDASDGGAVNWVGKDPAQLAEEVMGISEKAVFQIMHPRAMPAPGNLSNYFVSIDLLFDENGPYVGPDAFETEDVRLPADARWLSPLFNAMEVLTFGNVQGLSDWFNLLNAGSRLTATGNSDSHTRWVEASGYARNFVKVGVDHENLSAFDRDHFIESLHLGRNSVSLGPFIEMTVRRGDDTEEAEIGETLDVSGCGGEVFVDLRVQSPAWLISDRLTLYENGIPVETITATPSLVPAGPTGEPRNEFRTTVRRAVSADAHFVAAVTGDQSLYPLLPYNSESPGLVTMDKIRNNALQGTIKPFSLTNPIWVDIDGDGWITPCHVVIPQDCQYYSRVDRTDPYVPVPEMNCDCVLGNKAPGC